MVDTAPLSLPNLCPLPTTQDGPLWAGPGLPPLPRALELQCLPLSIPLTPHSLCYTLQSPPRLSPTQPEKIIMAITMVISNGGI